jgi:hypothetical protein
MTAKLCVNCKHYLIPDQPRASAGWVRDFSKCAHPNVASRVDGSGVDYCSSERDDAGWFRVLFGKWHCGPSGRGFEAKS